MLVEDGGNHDDDNTLPFANCEISTDVHVDFPRPAASTHPGQKRHRHSRKHRFNDGAENENGNIAFSKMSLVYFENSQEENNLLTFAPYTGPCNTSHLGTNLYLPQLTSQTKDNSAVSFQRFAQDYDKVVTSITKSLESMSLSIFLRFGISYINRLDVVPTQPMLMKEYIALRSRGKKLKASFYTCKGVTSPKRFLATIAKYDYRETSNAYSYDVQLYGDKNKQQILHFQYDESLHCHTIFYRRDHPVNFDFIRDKRSSIFRSVDDSYSDIFDFRIQLAVGKSLSQTDPLVLQTLRDVPIDQVLFIDPSNQGLHVSPKLQKFVKYLKCTRSSIFQNPENPFVICMGTYEEFQLNKQGQCELLMKASNTMTIELCNVTTVPTAQKLYETGLWFSSLCQTCVELTTTFDKRSKKSRKWFPTLLSRRKGHNQAIKNMNVSQLTTYRTQKSKGDYTTEELALVRKILQEETLQNIFANATEDKSNIKPDIEMTYENLMTKLKTSAVPSANEAMGKLTKAFNLLTKNSVK